MLNITTGRIVEIKKQLEQWDRGEDYSNEVTGTVRELLTVIEDAMHDKQFVGRIVVKEDPYPYKPFVSKESV